MRSFNQVFFLLALGIAVVYADRASSSQAPEGKTDQLKAADALCDELTKGLRTEDEIKKHPNAKLYDQPGEMPQLNDATTYVIGQLPINFMLYSYRYGRIKQIRRQERKESKDAWAVLDQMQERLGKPKLLVKNDHRNRTLYLATWSHLNGFFYISISALSRRVGSDEYDVHLLISLP